MKVFQDWYLEDKKYHVTRKDREHKKGNVKIHNWYRRSPKRDEKRAATIEVMATV